MRFARRLSLGHALVAIPTLAALACPAPTALGQEAANANHPRSVAPAASPKSPASKVELATALDALVPRLLTEGDVPGLSIAVVREGQVIWSGTYGLKDARTGTRVDGDTVFEAASLSKPVFAHLVLKLVDAGRLDLDTPLERYLPGDYVDDPRAGLITARRVLSHTAGLPNWRQGRSLKMLFAPGDRFSYSGEGFVYLQKAVERLTGETLDALTRRLVFEPLRMTSSRFVWDERFTGRKATGHDGVGSVLPSRRPAESNAAASLHTTALDYARFLIATLDGAGISKGLGAERLRQQIRLDEGCRVCTDKEATGRLSKELGWGLGWGLSETEDGPSFWHWGDNPGFHAYVAGFPRQRLGVVVFTNGSAGHGIIPEVVAAAIGGRHPALAWLDYERHNSPARTLFKAILARGDAAIAAYRDRKRDDPGAALTEPQVNRIGYWLSGKKRPKEAIAVFELNASDFPASWNVHDSLGEAYAADGQRERAIASYKRSIALNPDNANGVEALRKLEGGS